jgi:inner membrane transporter RhtA
MGVADAARVRMVPAEASDSCEGAGRLAHWTRRRSLGAVPPPALILVGIVSVQAGAGLAKQLFDQLPPSAIVLMRLLTSAVVLCVLGRRALPGLLRGHSHGDLAVAAGFGLTLALMNFSIYQSMARIPLGIAVTIEFLGPLGVAVAGSRRPLDLLWVLLAAGGVVLLSGPGGGDLAVGGVAAALAAAVLWAAYIHLSARTGRAFAGGTGLALAMPLAALVTAPAGIAQAGGALLEPGLLASAAVVAMASSVIPYSLELEALRRLPPRVFGVLMSLEPGVAALVGLVVLGQSLDARQIAAIGLVVVASAGAAGVAAPEA